MECKGLAMYNLYKKDRAHPFFFCKDVTNDFLAQLTEVFFDKKSALFLLSVGELEVFDKIVEGTNLKYKCIQINDEYIGIIYPPNSLMVNSVICHHNGFVDFDTKGVIIAKFDITFKSGRKRMNMKYGVVHFYNYGNDNINQIDDIDILFRSYDPVADCNLPGNS
jgi:hypothetical protein